MKQLSLFNGQSHFVSLRMLSLMALIGIQGTLGSACDFSDEDDEVGATASAGDTMPGTGTGGTGGTGGTDTGGIETGTTSTTGATTTMTGSGTGDTGMTTGADMTSMSTGDATGGTSSETGSTTMDTGSDTSSDTEDIDPNCGNAVIDLGEECDDGGETKFCDIDCTFPMCGDGRVNMTFGEECEDGNDMDGDGCNNNCTLTRKAVQVSAGTDHTCALTEDGAVRCWGSGRYGQLGYGSTEDVLSPSDEKARDVSLGEGVKAVQVEAGYRATCALLDNGRVRCWGNGGYGQIGNGTTQNIGDDELASSGGLVELGITPVKIAAGAGFICAQGVAGAVQCWGAATYGKLGYGNTNAIGDDETPKDAGNVPMGGAVLDIVPGYWTACSRMVNKEVRCWGYDSYGRLGYGERKERYGTPLVNGPVPLGTTVEQLAVGNDGDSGQGNIKSHACALLSDGKVRCWGPNTKGELGYASTGVIGDDEPASAGGGDTGVQVGATVVSLAAGGAHTCALIEGGQLRCWGFNDEGQLGYNHAENIGDDEHPAVAGTVPLQGTVTQVSLGAKHSCALLDTGMIKCWGYGANGRLGIGSTSNQAASTAVPVVL